jgi:uncharacterized protein YbjT (DUF2867 family)
VSALLAAGHSVLCGGRGGAKQDQSPACRHLEMDFSRDFDPVTWRRRLQGVDPSLDLVINAVGAIAPYGGQGLEAIHTRAPIALFDACATLGIRAINISALGANDAATSVFHLTKKAADDWLLGSSQDSVVLQPSLVYGVGGASARLFNLLASLPLIPVPGNGMQAVQPVHVEDLAAAVVVVAGGARQGLRVIPVVGPAPLSLGGFLAGLRQAMGMGRARFLPVPMWAVSVAMRVAGFAGARWASREALGMLVRGNTADPGPLRELLGRDPRPVAQFIQARERECTRLAASVAWLALLLRLSIAIVWLAAALVSALLYPIQGSVALVEHMGVNGDAAVALVYLGAAVDAAFGIATLLMRNRRLLWIGQCCVIVGYTAIITAWLPEYWLHPFGPVVKNIPLLAAIYALSELERR